MVWKLWSFILTEILLGKKISIIYGLGIGLALPTILLFAFLWEFIQIPFFFFIYNTAYKKINFLHKFRENIIKRTKKQKIFITLKKQGICGVALLAIYPFVGGGVLSSVLLASTLNLEKKKVYLMVTLATILSLMILTLLSILILKGISHPAINWLNQTR
jgi:uncharacterized membrane protein